MKVLIVDDSKTVLRINSQIVTSLGHESFTAENGQEALSLLKNNNIELIILDINMPVMNGFKFLENTLEYRKEKNIKIIMCTTEGGKGEVIKALKLGANNYIIKPIRREVLVEKIQGL
jgi:two-component system chemotaxis response regulator CheY